MKNINASNMGDLYIILSTMAILIVIEIGWPLLRYIEDNKEDDSDLDK